ncbi:DNA-binding protein [Testudinibacter sp. P27/CKL/0425]
MKSQNKQWFTASELVGVGGLPKQATNITRKAVKENWEKRQVKGAKGVAFEYYYLSLPSAALQELRNNPDYCLPENEPNLENKEKHRSTINTETLALAIETLEEALKETNRVIKPSKKADLVLTIYDLLLEESNKEPVLKLIKSIA